MNLPAHLEVKAEFQGIIEGSCDMKGREGTIFVSEVRHFIDTPSSEGHGKRVHKPFVIRKELDKSSPKLRQALVSGEKLKTVKLKSYRINSYGYEEHFFTHTLENAKVKSIELHHEIEHIAFSYQKIIWSWEPNGIEAEDYWKYPEDY